MLFFGIQWCFGQALDIFQEADFIRAAEDIDRDPERPRVLRAENAGYISQGQRARSGNMKRALVEVFLFRACWWMGDLDVFSMYVILVGILAVVALKHVHLPPKESIRLRVSGTVTLTWDFSGRKLFSWFQIHEVVDVELCAHTKCYSLGAANTPSEVATCSLLPWVRSMLR